MKKFGLDRWGQIPLHPAAENRDSRLNARLPFVVAACILIGIALIYIFAIH